MQTANILIVEDERIIALDLSDRLSALGYKVVGTAANGKTAMEKAQTYLPDIVLMDIHLEGDMDGAQAAQKIHRSLGIPVVFLTAYAEDGTLSRALESLPFGYLVKPVDTRELHATLQTALTRRETEEALARSERRLQLALDAARLGVWEWEYDSGRFTTGGLFNVILGDAPDMVNESIEQFIDRLHPEDKLNAGAILGQAMQDKATISAIFRLAPGHDNSARWVEIHARVDQSSDCERLVGVIKDVTERRKMEDDLRQSAAVFETISEGLFTLDKDSRLISANPAFCALTGHTCEEILGANPDDFLHARRHSDQFYQVLATAAHGHWEGETWCRRKNGEIFPVWESIRAVMDPRGKVSYYVASITDITPLRRAEEKINHLAYHDPLTGLPNRMLFNDRLDQALAAAERNNKPCAILFIDLDGFKSINDTLGHSSGDLLLQVIASRIQRALRSTDTVARLGGDEFVVIIADLDRHETASRLSDKLLTEFKVPVDLAGERVAVSGSIGIAIYPGDGQNRVDLMRAADTAMYSAKSQGKNQACFYTPALAAQVIERMNLEQGLRQALEAEAFTLHYQPQFRLSDNKLVGVEALIRWFHPKHGLIPPNAFIPIAEDCGLIGAIGAWVLRTACGQVAQWIEQSGASIRLSVNVSARQMQHGDILDILNKVLEETRFPPSLLELEITESTLQVLEDSRKLLERMRALGIGVIIDDFGTGYSSLSVLKHLPIDRLKIDQSFVHDVPHDENGVGIVEAIVAMGKKLKLQLIAEGVERNDQLEFLQNLKCDEVQGFLLGRPMTWDELVALLREAANGQRV